MDIYDRSEIVTQAEKDLMYSEMINLLCGDYIADGASRVVYKCRILPDCVIKLSKIALEGTNQNHQEYLTWGAIANNKKFSKYLAPVVWCSNNYKILIMKYCEPIQKSQMPRYLPKFISDRHIGNFGYYEDRVVCLDYGLTNHIIHKDLLKLEINKDNSKC